MDIFIMLHLEEISRILTPLVLIVTLNVRACLQEIEPFNTCVDNCWGIQHSSPNALSGLGVWVAEEMDLTSVVCIFGVPLMILSVR